MDAKGSGRIPSIIRTVIEAT